MFHRKSPPANPNRGRKYDPSKLKEIYLAGGCFWGVEAFMARVPGVADAVSGYANGSTDNPTYEDVCRRGTGHAETVLVKYDPSIIGLDHLLRAFFRIVDPTAVNCQGNDVGVQYRSGVYYTDAADRAVIETVLQEVRRAHSEPVVTEVLPLMNFTTAEEYHQDYLEKNPGGYCHVDFSLLEEPNRKGEDHEV